VREHETDSSGPGEGLVVGNCKHVNETFIRSAGLRDKLSDYKLLKKDFAPWSYLFIYLFY
jgi:hypothetical protein